MNKLALFSFVLLGLVACNKKDKSSGTSASTNDAFIASAKTATDEAADAITESGTSSNFQPMAGNLSPLTLTASKTCTNSGADASVAISFSGSDQLTFSKTYLGATINVTIDVTKTGTETRLWSPAQCSGDHANINWLSGGAGANLTLNVTLDRTINRNKTIAVTKASGEVVNRTATDNVVVTGTRTITWGAPVVSSTNVSRTKTITSSVNRAVSYTKANGTSGSLTTTTTVEAGTPLSVEVVRDNTSGALVSKTVASGTVKVTLTDGSYTSCVYANVKYEFGSNTNKCLPTSGTITCSKYDGSTATTASSSTLISFGQSTTSTVSISTDGSAAEDFSDYNARGCDLESAT